MFCAITDASVFLLSVKIMSNSLCKIILPFHDKSDICKEMTV